MIAARDYSQCEDPAGAMREAAIARRAKFAPRLDPVVIRRAERSAQPALPSPAIIVRIDDEEAAREARIAREKQAAIETERKRREDEATAAWTAMLDRAVATYHANPDLARIDHRRRAVAIMEEVAKLTGFDATELKSHRRAAKVVLPRQIAMWLCRKFTPDSMPRIGQTFGGRDHTTVLHSCRKIDALAADVTPAEDTVAGWVEALLPLGARA